MKSQKNTEMASIRHTNHKPDKSHLIVMEVTSARLHSWMKPLLHSQLLVQFGQGSPKS